jgi:basic membrane lipoprotein Med (substrate-binding protein (PBP1-ABC) superfamily)
MKKALALIMAAILLLAIFAGCSNTATQSPAASSAAPSAAASAAPSTEAAASTAPSAAASAEPSAAPSESTGKDVAELKIGAITTFVKEDGGWCQAQYKGIVAAMANLGIPEENLIFVENTPEEVTAVTSAIDALATEGVDIIMGASTGYAPILSDLTSQYPDITFAQVGDKADNLICYQIRDYQAMFLLGATSALVSDNSLLGYSAGMSEASVRRGINSFAIGAKYVEPDSKVQLVWANSWYDVDKETQCAKSLIDMGITCIGINASSPAIPQTCQENGVYCTGYHQDMLDYAPEAVMVSFIWNWAPIFEQVFTSVADGTATADDYYFWGADKNCAIISAFNNDIVPKDIQDKVLELQKKIIAGEIEVFSGELKDNQGNVLVKTAEVMSDKDISAQKFLVENVVGEW